MSEETKSETVTVPITPAIRSQTIVDAVLGKVQAELIYAQQHFGPMNSAHEGFAVLLEEVDELKAHVWTQQKNRSLEKMQTEAIQVAAMAVRFAIDVCTELRGRK